MDKLRQGGRLGRVLGILLGGFFLSFFLQAATFAQFHQPTPVSPFMAERTATFYSNFQFNRSIYERLHTLSESIGYGRGDRFVNSDSPDSFYLNGNEFAPDHGGTLMLGQVRDWPERIRRFKNREKAGFYLQGNLDRLHHKDDFEIGEFESELYGFSFGLDKIYSRNLILGVAFAGSYADTWTTAQKADFDSCAGSVYGIWCQNDWSFAGVFGLAFNNYDAKFRNNAISGARSDHKADHYFISGEISRKMRLVNFDMSPFCFLHYQRLNEDSYCENGRDFTVDSAGTDSLRHLIGLRFGKRIPFGDSFVFDPKFEAAWLHDYTNETMSLSGLENGLAYLCTERTPGRDCGYLSLSFDFRMNPHRVAFCRLGSEIGRRYTSTAAQLGFSFAF